MKIPGLQHISEDVFKLLDKKSLLECRMVNSSWKEVLDQPIFWLKKMKLANIPQDSQTGWNLLAHELDEEDDEVSAGGGGAAASFSGTLTSPSSPAGCSGLLEVKWMTFCRELVITMPSCS